jgi:glycosyltransferase involved in cell wall biosynthesis
VNTEKFSPEVDSSGVLPNQNEQEISILFPRTFRIARGAHIFIESLNILSEKYDVRTYFLGAQKKEAKYNLQDKIKEYDLSNTIDFLGHVPHDEMPMYYNAVDIVAIPTYHSEGSSIACIEAMACGKPVVVTDVGGLKELVYIDEIDGGLKIKPTPQDLAGALAKLITNDDLRKKLGRNARSRAIDYYTIDRWKSQMHKYFDEVIGGQ